MSFEVFSLKKKKNGQFFRNHHNNTSCVKYPLAEKSIPGPRQVIRDDGGRDNNDNNDNTQKGLSYKVQAADPINFIGPRAVAVFGQLRGGGGLRMYTNDNCPVQVLA